MVILGHFGPNRQAVTTGSFTPSPSGQIHYPCVSGILPGSKVVSGRLARLHQCVQMRDVRKPSLSESNELHHDDIIEFNKCQRIHLCQDSVLYQNARHKTSR